MRLAEVTIRNDRRHFSAPPHQEFLAAPVVHKITIEDFIRSIARITGEVVHVALLSAVVHEQAIVDPTGTLADIVDDILSAVLFKDTPFDERARSVGALNCRSAVHSRVVLEDAITNDGRRPTDVYSATKCPTAQYIAGIRIADCDVFQN